MNTKKPFIGSLEEYRELFEEMADIILIVNEKGTVEYVNRALRRNLGYKNKRFTGRSISECLLFDRHVSKKEIIRQIFQLRDFHTEVHMSKNMTFHYAWRTKIFTHQGKKKAIAVVRDTTTQMELQKRVQNYTKDLEEMVHQRTQQLEKEKQRAIELHQIKNTFLSRMSHELRTPLTAIRGYAELLQEESLTPEERKNHVSVVEKNARHLLDMVNETLQLIQMEQEKYQIQEKTFSLQPLVEEVVDTYKVLARKKVLKLDYELSEDLPQDIYSDPNAVRQILTNLIGNAIKFTEQGSVRVSVKIRHFPYKLNSKLYFYIEDTGLGIPKDQQKRIFKSFEQYLDHQSTHSRGTGLGLPISRQLAKLLGGDVKLMTSEPFKGSVFVFSLNVRKSA